MNNSYKLQLFLIALILGFLTGPKAMLALSKISAEDTITPADSAMGTTVRGTVNTDVPSEPVSAYSSLHDIAAKSVYVWDIQKGKKLYSKNEYAELPLASVTKMMMAVVAKELLPQDALIPIRPNDIREEGDDGLLVGEVWDFNKLLNFTLIASSNDGASAIASVAGATLAHASSTDPLTNKKLFIEKMNEKARAIGLKNTYFKNESGLDIASLTAGAYGSSRDMAMLFDYVYRKHPDLFTPTTHANEDIISESKVTHHVMNTNQDVARINGIIGSKTGYTDLAGGNLVVVVDIGIDHPVVVAVLGSTIAGRFTDVEQLIDATVLEITGQAPRH